MTRTHALLRSLAGASLLTLAGCVGIIAEAPSQSVDGAVSLADATPQTEAAAPLPPPVDPQRVTIHRLNRTEYNNTVRDLLGTRRTPADEFPADDRGYGFDNIADVLSLSPVHLELYDRAAEVLVEEAIGTAGPEAIRVQREAEMLMGTSGRATANGWNLSSMGEVGASIALPAAGRYRFTVRAWQARAGADDARMALEVAGVAARTVDVPNLAASPGEFSVEVTRTAAGSVRFGAAFTNDFYNAGPPVQDRNLVVDWIRVEGPLGATATMPPASRARWITCDPAMNGETCATEVLTRFARRAWRRPATETEVSALWTRMRAVTRMHDGSWEDAVKLAMRAMLVSPHFVFRVEIDSDPTNAAAHPLSDHELASRLSYFLYSSMPDAELDRLADAGQLHDPAVLRAQAERMLEDEKSRAFVANFAGQWLHTRALDDHETNATLYPAFNEALRASMRAETEGYFQHFLRSDVSMSTFLTADFTFADDNLARHYGLAPSMGTGVRQTPLAGTPRLGLLTQGTTLTVTSHADRTSPVKRGQWVLSQLLCTPPPPPPPEVEGLPMEAMPTGSLRQRLERHRADPLCASCHNLMDPIGFSLENFDAIGAHRTRDGAYDIDTTGMLTGGQRFDDGAGLARLVQQDPRFSHCVTEQVLIYALGRGLNAEDDPQVTRLVSEWRAAGMQLRDLVLRVVLSEAFRNRRPETAR